MERIDETIRKPRRTKGTPTFYYRNIFAIGTIFVGTGLFALCYPFIRKGDAVLTKLAQPTEQEKERKILMDIVPIAETTRQIQEKIDETMKFFFER